MIYSQEKSSFIFVSFVADDMPWNQEDLSVYVAKLQETVCKEASEQGLECPSVEGVQAIVEAAKEGEFDSDDTECPIKDMCSGANPLQTLSTQISDVLLVQTTCSHFVHVRRRVGPIKFQYFLTLTATETHR